MSQFIGANIRARRRELGLNQEELAEKLKLTQANISRIEANPRGPTGEMLISLADALSCDVRKLLGLPILPEDSADDLDNDAKAFLRSMVKSDPQVSGYLRNFVRGSENFTEEDWSFLAANLKLMLGYATDVLKKAGRVKAPGSAN
ncbi:MAG: helix-turn-helix transcriptional regulator [Synergistaceae bacterium]|jgi:transcriptional regulator with XRE-family HTH domain|nr:helix-turn-helix transcriptional regulator [Synergistaceae bacterium]